MSNAAPAAVEPSRGDCSIGGLGVILFDDDVAFDARSLLEDALGSAAPPWQGIHDVPVCMSEYLKESDDGPMVTSALADPLLDGGGVGHPLLEQARRDSETGDVLERWQGAGADALAERLAIDQRLASRLLQEPSSGSACLYPPLPARLPVISASRTAPRPP